MNGAVCGLEAICACSFWATLMFCRHYHSGHHRLLLAEHRQRGGRDLRGPQARLCQLLRLQQQKQQQYQGQGAASGGAVQAMCVQAALGAW